MIGPIGWNSGRRLIARVYKWPPSEMAEMTLEDFKFWKKAALEVLKGGY